MADGPRAHGPGGPESSAEGAPAEGAPTDAAPRPATAGRSRLVAFAALVVLAGALLLAWSQPWFVVRLPGDAVEVGGDVAAGGLAPFALTTLALVAALALAGPVLRVVLAVLGAALGVGAIVVAGFALAEPVRAVAPAVTGLTGVSGVDSVAALVESVVPTAWPVVAVVVAASLVVTGAGIAVVAPRWPSSGRRYARSRLAADAPRSSVDDWDALSEGTDPTDAVPPPVPPTGPPPPAR